MKKTIYAVTPCNTTISTLVYLVLLVVTTTPNKRASRGLGEAINSFPGAFAGVDKKCEEPFAFKKYQVFFLARNPQ